MDDRRRSLLESRTRHDAGAVERRIFETWRAAGAFRSDPAAPGEPYTIMLPLPNVTGSLHMGHALNGSVQDLLIRLKRMQGRNVLWQAGTDHAGIGTQVVVEKQLAAEGLTRHDLGRERFAERVWAWRDESGAQIIQQFERLGASFDYGRERFTMDDDYARSVVEAFVRLHERGVIYRDSYLVNWDVALRTAISDLEVEHRDVDDTLFHVRYGVEGGGEITVATVRPVTILADVAVAVHPDDPRYADLVGRTAIVPLVDRPVPVIGDARVARDFGTGALKITPGHDPTDFEIGRDHGLPVLTMLREDGSLADLRPDWAGIDLEDGHRRAVEELRAAGRIVHEEPYRHSVGHSVRTGRRIEPLVSLQWFCRMDELAAPALEAVRAGRVRFHPRRTEKIFFDWTEAIRPWCISRQLWWGHRLPVWFAPDGSYVVARERPEGDGWTQSDDVLDTWFSSALWPYATLGWPERTPDLETWYPGDVLVTARDIINLWVARMLMTGLEFLGEPPFTDVYIHSVIQAPDGRRMSKSLGTGIDPLELIDAYGADATRYGLLKMSSTQDVRFAPGAIEEGRGLANKIWNAARLILLNAAPDARPRAGVDEPVDRWILSRLRTVTEEVTGLYEAYAFAAATKVLYGFVWNEVCDWYIEALKVRLYGDDDAARRQASETALYVLERVLGLLHPAMPFVTEEIWSFLPGERGLLMTSPFPTPDEVPADAGAERAVTGAIELISGLRSMRQEAGLPPAAPLVLAVTGGGDAEALRAQAGLIERLGHARIDGDRPGGVPLTVGDARVGVHGEGLADRVRDRLRRQVETARAELGKAERKLADDRFVQRAPAAVVAEERLRADRFGRELEELARRLDELAG